MKTTVNKLRIELEELANASEMIAQFYWKDLLRAMSENVCEYPLMAVHYTTGAILVNQDRIQLEISICDKIDKDWNFNLNDVESDTLNVQRQIFNAMQSPRWKQLGRIESATVRKFIAEGKDYVAGHTMSLSFLLRDKNGVCDLPIFGYDFDQIVDDTNTVSVFNSDMSYSVVVDVGSSLELPDILFEVKNTLGDVLSSATVPSVNNIDSTLSDVNNVDSDGQIAPTPAGVPFVCTPIAPCDDATITLFGDPFLSVASGATEDVTIVDQNSNPVAPDSVTGSEITVTIPETRSTAKLMKTGQTTSYRTGDDGDLELGREVSWLVLSENNPFGNTNRFTDELGGSVYANSIALDWSTYDGATVLAWYFGAFPLETWNNAIDNAIALTVGGFAGWRIPNSTEGMSIIYLGNFYSWNYAPFNNTSLSVVWTCTTSPTGTGNAMVTWTDHRLDVRGKGSTSFSFRCRYFTNAELGI